MPTIIADGSDKCYSVNYLCCPVCGEKFEQETNAPFIYSETLGDSVKVCPKHDPKKAFTVEEEIEIQNCLQRALKHDRGRITNSSGTVKKSKLMIKYSV